MNIDLYKYTETCLTGMIHMIFTSAKEVMFLPEFVCLCVSKITQKVMKGSF